jgi:hypothetical protein
MGPVWTPAAEPASRRASVAEPALSRAVGQFAVAALDAQRMVRAKLPVLPHQQAAMETGLAAIQAARPGIIRSDVVGAFDAQPGLIAPAAEGVAGRAVAITAIEATREQRLGLEGQARAAVQRWRALERGYDQAERGSDREVVRKAVGDMATFAKELKGDRKLDSLLRQRGQEFGIKAGSRLDRVVRGAGWTPELAHKLERGLRRGGPSRGMRL